MNYIYNCSQKNIINYIEKWLRDSRYDQCEDWRIIQKQFELKLLD